MHPRMPHWGLCPDSVTDALLDTGDLGLELSRTAVIQAEIVLQRSTAEGESAS